MRSIWKGHIRFSLVTIPIRVYNAVDSAQTIRLHQIHKGCNGNVGYEKKCKKCSQIVPNEEIVKGYEYEPERYVIVEPEDLEKLKLKSTKIIEIEGFVDASEIHPTLYESPYYVGPDGIVASKAYALLYSVLEESKKVGVGKVALRDREDGVIIAPLGGCLLLYKLRYPSELRSTREVPDLDAVKDLDPQQLKLARSLVDTMSSTFADIELRDNYQEALRDLIQAKIEGKEVVQVTEAEQPVMDIMAALKQSIEQAKALRKPMVKATGKKPKEEVAMPGQAAAADAKPVRARKRA